MPGPLGYAASRAALASATALLSLVLFTRPSSGSWSIVPANLTRNIATATTLSASYMLSKSETEALAVSNRGKISLHDGYKTTSAIDSKHQTVLVERVCCARTEFFLFHSRKRVLPDAIDANLSGLGIKGVAVGATDAAVFRRFGRSSSTLLNGSGVVQYLVPWNDHCVMRYTFDIDRHTVRGMSARDAC